MQGVDKTKNVEAKNIINNLIPNQLSKGLKVNPKSPSSGNKPAPLVKVNSEALDINKGVNTKNNNEIAVTAVEITQIAKIIFNILYAEFPSLAKAQSYI